MSDFNVDTADRDELEAVATDLDVKFQSNTGDDTLRSRIKEALGVVTPAASTTSPSTPSSGVPEKEKRFEIIVSTDSQDKQPVQVGVNGRTYVIKRGEKVIVPASVIEVLSNAVRVEYDDKMNESYFHSYPFQVLKEV